MVDPRAARGFDGAADAYERGRPSYPAEAVATLARELGLSAAGAALDLAAGTGKLTRLLTPSAGRVIAVDPSSAMLAELRRRLPSVDARLGAAEALPLADGEVDAVFVGEAFHWFGTAVTCREIARVLAPGGGLGLLWNRERWSAADLPWLPELRALLAPHRRAAGPFPAGGNRWRRALQISGRFAPLSSAEAHHVHEVDADGLVALIQSYSWIANLPPRRRTIVLARVRELAGGQVRIALRYRTELHWTRALSGAQASTSGR